MKTLLALLFLSISPAFAVQIKVAEAPYNDLALTIQTIETAKKHLLVNIYELTSPVIADALAERIAAGVHVEILEEGQPVGGMSKAAKAIVGRLSKAMKDSDNAEDHFYIMTSRKGGQRRFHFDHAKYVVADGENLLIGSENYSPTGNPSPGAEGNRGWEVLVHDSALAEKFQAIYRQDSDTSNDDIVDVTQDERVPFGGKPESGTPDFSNLKILAKEMPIFDASEVRPVLSPDTSLADLVDMLEKAQRSIDIEQMTLDSRWGKEGTNSPLLGAIVAAARRGVQVRVLLNDETVFDKGDRASRKKNVETAKILNNLARKEHLRLAARIADVQEMGVTYIHNKGALIDGERTLVSSINWNENAVEHNREAAVLIQSGDIFSHYEELFDSDWKASAKASEL